MGKYGNAAVLANRLVRGGAARSPNEAWEAAVVGVFANRRSAQQKGCPRAAYLGLCGDGAVAGIPPGHYCRPGKNRGYALEAVFIALPAFAVEVLKQHLAEQDARREELGPLYEDHGLVFPREDGRPWDPSRFSTRFREFDDGLDLPRIRLHDLRHGHCSQLLRQGTPLKMASARMGHSTIAITADLYGHILEGQDWAAADLFNIALPEAFQEVASPR